MKKVQENGAKLNNLHASVFSGIKDEVLIQGNLRISKSISHC